MIKNNLYIFGCSFSSPYHEDTDEYRRYKTFKYFKKNNKTI